MAANNKNVILIMGLPNSGKSHCLQGLTNPDKWVYFNTDLKPLPCEVNFNTVVDIDDPLQLPDFIDQVEANPDIDGAVIDTITYLMEQFENQYILNAKDTRAAWGSYAQFYKSLIHKIKSGTKSYVILGHLHTETNETTGAENTYVPVKGAIKRTGIEGDFTTVVETAIVRPTILQDFENELLTITEDEAQDKAKRVFITRTTGANLSSKMRSPPIWARNELYIDNNVQHILDRLHGFYNK